MNRLFVLTLLFPAYTFAIDTSTFLASEIKSKSGKGRLFKHELVIFGLSCSSGPVSELLLPESISLGQTIKFETGSIKVGLIKVTHFDEDVEWQGEYIGRKGERSCVVAESENKLPTADDCDALWVHIPQCIVVSI